MNHRGAELPVRKQCLGFTPPDGVVVVEMGTGHGKPSCPGRLTYIIILIGKNRDGTIPAACPWRLDVRAGASGIQWCPDALPPADKQGFGRSVLHTLSKLNAVYTWTGTQQVTSPRALS